VNGIEGTRLAWAQGVGRSNRPAPTKPPADSKRVVGPAFHRFRPFFASTVPELCQNPFSSPSLCQNPSRSHSRADSAFQSFALHLEFHLRVFLKDLRIALAQQLSHPLVRHTSRAEAGGIR
jgi:hypothetical protein